jgi:uncharacterized protein (TIGR03663 family)
MPAALQYALSVLRSRRAAGDGDGGAHDGDTDSHSTETDAPGPRAEPTDDATRADLSSGGSDGADGSDDDPAAASGPAGDSTDASSPNSTSDGTDAGNQPDDPSETTAAAGDDRRVLLALVGIALAGILLRLYALGRRVAYYDEAWLGYWVLRANETGLWEYRPIVHGPFFARVNGPIFAAVGASDVTARLVVALLGGLVPLVAYCFRERLSAGETVLTGALLAGTPLLVYYSRMARNDVPLAVFALLSVGFAVRYADTRRVRYVYGAAVAFALATTTKESALLYLVTWVGAGALVVDRGLLVARHRDGRSARATVLQAADDALDEAARLLPQLVGAALLFLAVVVYFYAPRTPPGQPGLRTMLSNPATIPVVVEEATVGSLRSALGHWVGGSKQRHPYLPYLLDTLRTLAAGGLAVVVLAPVGFLVERYREAARPLVTFSAYAGAAAVVGYPLANNFPVPWSTVHAVVPLAVPAAVGGVALARAGLAVADWRPSAPQAGVATDGGATPGLQGVVVAGLVVVLAAGLALQGAATVVETSYQHPDESPDADGGNEVVYYAQPPGELRAVTGAIRRAAATPGEPDVLYVGEPLAAEEAALSRPPPTGAFFERIPLPWYTETAGAEVDSVETVAGLSRYDRPAVVVTTESFREPVARRLPETYTARRYPLDDYGSRHLVVFTPADGAGG